MPAGKAYSMLLDCSFAPDGAGLEFAQEITASSSPLAV
jgi:hypothetical protein